VLAVELLLSDMESLLLAPGLKGRVAVLPALGVGEGLISAAVAPTLLLPPLSEGVSEGMAAKEGVAVPPTLLVVLLESTPCSEWGVGKVEGDSEAPVLPEALPESLPARALPEAAVGGAAAAGALAVAAAALAEETAATVPSALPAERRQDTDAVKAPAPPLLALCWPLTEATALLLLLLLLPLLMPLLMLRLMLELLLLQPLALLLRLGEGALLAEPACAATEALPLPLPLGEGALLELPTCAAAVALLPMPLGEGATLALGPTLALPLAVVLALALALALAEDASRRAMA
jgi:hypothetical protein